MNSVALATHELDFKFAAGTSRGILRRHTAHYIKLDRNQKVGIGEAAPLAGLSLESKEEALRQLHTAGRALNDLGTWPINENDIYSIAKSLANNVASVRFALEQALLAWQNASADREFSQQHWSGNFVEGKEGIKTNGLIWMGDHKEMITRAEEKLQAGFSCLKMKIGAINYADELAILKALRKNFSYKELTLRVDANGAFAYDEAKEVLRDLKKLEIHSIEQPIMAGQLDEMAKLCADAAIPVALDEELIGVREEEYEHLLDYIKPAYIILKPTLLGGAAVCHQLVSSARQRNIGYWFTSALESNVGLNAVAQLANSFDIEIPQGLGTGQLYYNNIDSPLVLENEWLWSRSGNWNMTKLNWQAL